VAVLTSDVCEHSQPIIVRFMADETAAIFASLIAAIHSQHALWLRQNMMRCRDTIMQCLIEAMVSVLANVVSTKVLIRP